MSQLFADCLDEIFEYLKKDRVTLHSCLLVNRLWSKVAVRILWRSVWWIYRTSSYSTLIACLPNESKEVLYNNGIIISAPTSKPPVFNYASFCKILIINQIDIHILKLLLKNQQYISSQSLGNSKYIVAQELYKLFMSQITSLKQIDFDHPLPADVAFTSYPGAEDCLKDLLELNCRSDISPEFFYKLSKISHNMKSLYIEFREDISNGLTDLISVQQNLKYLTMFLGEHGHENFVNIIPTLTKLPNTLIQLNISGIGHIQISFIANLTNLQELILSFTDNPAINEDFEKLQYITFPQLKILKIQETCPRYDFLIKFLENNGKNLKILYVGDRFGNSDDSLNSAIAKFCPKLRKLSTGFKSDELETMKMIFNSCKYLKSIKIWCGGAYLNDNKALEMALECSPKNFSELKLNYLHDVEFDLLPVKLESFFISWKNNRPKKSLSLIINTDGVNSLDTNDKNMEIINKYIELGVVRKFKILDLYDFEF